MEEIASVIDAKIRQKNGWTNKSLGERVGISTSQISKIRNAQINADVEELDRIYIAFGLDTATEIATALAKSERRHFER